MRLLVLGVLSLHKCRRELGAIITIRQLYSDVAPRSGALLLPPLLFDRHVFLNHIIIIYDYLSPLFVRIEGIFIVEHFKATRYVIQTEKLPRLLV